MTTTRKQYSASFKARVAVEAMRGEKTVSQLGSQFKIGCLKVELDWLKKKWACSTEDLRLLVDRGHSEISMRGQCELLGVNRSGLYYEPLGESQENLRLMRLLDQQYTRTPFYGSRKMVEGLATQGFDINRKRVSRLMARSRRQGHGGVTVCRHEDVPQVLPISGRCQVQRQTVGAPDPCIKPAFHGTPITRS